MNTATQPDWEYLGNLGDTEPLWFGGAFLYSDRTGVHAPELHVVEPEPGGDRTRPDRSKWEVRTIVLDRCTYIDDILLSSNQSVWFEGKDISRAADYIGDSADKLIAKLCSPNTLERAEAYLALYSYFCPDYLNISTSCFDNIDDIAARFPEPLA